jgi:hypothetical protein
MILAYARFGDVVVFDINLAPIIKNRPLVFSLTSIILERL